jgi:hypothetical protein
MPVGGLLRLLMLTRSGVAKRLGRSIATVRRLEGRELFPVVDKTGVHRFADDQVSRLVLRLRSGGSLDGARGDWLAGRRPSRANRQQLAHSTSAASNVNAIARERTAAQQEVAVAILELLDARHLRRLGPALRDYLASLLER